jgi:threonine synthase
VANRRLTHFVPPRPVAQNAYGCGREQLIRANRIANETTGIPVDATGSSGLAGLLDLADHGCLDSGESIAVLFTGKRREK